MVKITYNSNNEEESEMIEDYYFFKYYVKSLRSDWKQYIDYGFQDYNIEQSYLDRQEKVINIIKQHLNPEEYTRLKNILTFKLHQKANSDQEAFNLIFDFGIVLINNYKYLLMFKFGNKK